MTTPPVIRIHNDSAMLFASSAIWDPEAQQLVAAQVVTTSQEILKAIKATLANNSGKSFLTIRSPDGNAFLRSARRGFINVSSSLVESHAEGTITTLLHPLTGDPQAYSADHFYVVVVPGEVVSEKFFERLDLAIPWPLRPEWANYLLKAGSFSDQLVVACPRSGYDFTTGLRVSKNETKWQQIIADGLKNLHIQI